MLALTKVPLNQTNENLYEGCGSIFHPNNPNSYWDFFTLYASYQVAGNETIQWWAFYLIEASNGRHHSFFTKHENRWSVCNVSIGYFDSHSVFCFLLTRNGHFSTPVKYQNERWIVRVKRLLQMIESFLRFSNDISWGTKLLLCFPNLLIWYANSRRIVPLCNLGPNLVDWGIILTTEYEIIFPYTLIFR